jgi:PKD repeat protein
MKKTTILLMLLSVLFSQSIYAQSTKSIVEGQKVIIESTKNLLNIEPNITEDFENYSDFTTSFSPWILNDIDQTVTYGITDITFPNSGTEMAYIIFNPNNTTPSLGDDSELAAHSGEKFAACFSSIPSEGSTNNDWLITPALSLNGNSGLNFYAKSYTTEYGAEKLNVLVSTSGTNPSDFTAITENTLLLPSDWTEFTYDLSQYNNQEIHIAFQCVSEDAFILMLDDILVSTDENTGGSTLNGQVTNALDGMPVEGALVQVAGLSDLTDASGNYSINNVPMGTLTSNFMGSPVTGDSPLVVQFTDLSTSGSQLVTCSASDFITYSNNQVIIPSGGNLTLNISLSPIITGDGMRFVLNWGQDPQDLDSHLRTPEIEGNAYHVYYPSGNQGSATSPPYATLDHDVTQSYGPETITIYDFFSGVYHYYIYKYAGEGELITSHAVVQIYNNNGLLHTIQVPTSGTGDYWYLGTINGDNQAITIINTIQESEPGTGKTNVIYPEKPKETKSNLAEINTWNWSFGDGQTSTLQNPTHTYQNGGSYTVSLRVGDEINENTFIRENYIYVEGSQGSATLSGMVTNALDGTPIEGALVEVAGLSDFTDSNGNYVIENVPEGTLTSNFTATPSQGRKPLNVQFTDFSTSNTQLVSCSKEGFSTYNNNQVVIPNGSTVNLNISLSPIISGDNLRFVVNWGAEPNDLDSHLKTPEIEGQAYHIYYPSSSQGSADSPPYATLDHDVTQGYGPETITIYDFFNGDYHYYIRQYSSNGELTTSGAVVQIYDQSGLIQTLQVPTTGTGIYWYVGTINGATQTLNIINTIQQDEPGFVKTITEYPPKPRIEKNSLFDIISWNWNFGDGQSSDLESPSHIFTSDGEFTISLTVNDGNGTDMETKLNYIKVGDVFSVQEISSDMIDLYPNPSNGFIKLTSVIDMTMVQIYDQSGKLLLSNKLSNKSETINLEDFNSGIYLIKIHTEKGSLSKKLIVK